MVIKRGNESGIQGRRDEEGLVMIGKKMGSEVDGVTVRKKGRGGAGDDGEEGE